MIKSRPLPLESTVGGLTIKSTLGLALLIAVISACSDKPDASSKALAIINGKEITASEFDLRWSQIPDYARKTFAGPTGRKKFLDKLLQEFLASGGTRKGLPSVVRNLGPPHAGNSWRGFSTTSSRTPR